MPGCLAQCTCVKSIFKTKTYLDGTAASFHRSFEIFFDDSSSAEHAAIRKPLSRNVANWQLGQHHRRPWRKWEWNFVTIAALLHSKTHSLHQLHGPTIFPFNAYLHHGASEVFRRECSTPRRRQAGILRHCPLEPRHFPRTDKKAEKIQVTTVHKSFCLLRTIFRLKTLLISPFHSSVRARCWEARFWGFRFSFFAFQNQRKKRSS